MGWDRRRHMSGAAVAVIAWGAFLAAPMLAEFGAPTVGGSALELEAQQRPHVRSARQVVIRLALDGETQRLELADGSRLVGRVVADGDPVEFELTSGSVILVARADIQRLDSMEGRLQEGRFWRKDPSHNRLFFGPTGRTVGQDHGYVAVFEAVFPTVSVGLHDRFTIGAGTLMIGDFGDGHPFWILPKFNLIQNEDVAISAGALLARAGGEWARLLYGVGTLGSPDASVTAGFGAGSLGDNELDLTAFQLGGMVRVHESLGLMTENYLIRDEYENIGLLGGGVRFIGERLTADLGVAIPTEDPILLPLVNFVWNW